MWPIVIPLSCVSRQRCAWVIIGPGTEELCSARSIVQSFTRAVGVPIFWILILRPWGSAETTARGMSILPSPRQYSTCYVLTDHPRSALTLPSSHKAIGTERGSGSVNNAGYRGGGGGGGSEQKIDG
jgi:hypothetical protein